MEYNRYWKELNLHCCFCLATTLLQLDHGKGLWFTHSRNHESLPIDLQARTLLATGDVDDILIGNIRLLMKS
ncbi:MAG: hypothetical protein ACLRQF_09520 [Thomasclavelia ramosa]